MECMFELQLYTTKQMNVKVMVLKKINQAQNNILYSSTRKTQKKKSKTELLFVMQTVDSKQIAKL